MLPRTKESFGSPYMTDRHPEAESVLPGGDLPRVRSAFVFDSVSRLVPQASGLGSHPCPESLLFPANISMGQSTSRVLLARTACVTRGLWQSSGYYPNAIGSIRMVKAPITIEGSCSLLNSGLKPEDSDNIPAPEMGGCKRDGSREKLKVSLPWERPALSAVLGIQVYSNLKTPTFSCVFALY